jgi:hypothetical protein
MEALLIKRSPKDVKKQKLAMRALERCSVKKCGAPVEGKRKDVLRKNKINQKIYRDCDKKFPTPKECKDSDFKTGKCSKVIDRRMKCVIKKECATKSEKEFLKKMSREYIQRLKCRQKKCVPQEDRLHQSIFSTKK